MSCRMRSLVDGTQDGERKGSCQWRSVRERRVGRGAEATSPYIASKSSAMVLAVSLHCCGPRIPGQYSIHPRGCQRLSARSRGAHPARCRARISGESSGLCSRRPGVILNGSWSSMVLLNFASGLFGAVCPSLESARQKSYGIHSDQTV